MMPCALAGLIEGNRSPEIDTIGHFRPLEFPRVPRNQPFLRLLHLDAVFNPLSEQAVRIANAIAVAGNAESRHGIEKTGRQPSKSTIAEGRIGFHRKDRFVIKIQIGDRRSAGVF